MNNTDEKQEIKVSGNKILRWQDMGGNFFKNALLRFKLVLRLMKDTRIGWSLKIIPLFTLFYMVIPLDIPGPFDDAAVIWFGTELFIELCPQNVVLEHSRQLLGQANMVNESPVKEVVDAQFKDIEK